MSKPEKIKILYIDDEPNNLMGFKATFRHDYDVLIAESADEGMQIVEQNQDLKVILCDQRMPNKTGVEFFEEITTKYPQPVRMLLTGYTDIESVIDAINKGHIFRYITKPWQEGEVRSAIEEGYKFYITSSMLDLKSGELKKAYEELDKFAYSITHDMRGPMISVLGALDLVRNSEDPQERNMILEMMENSIHKVNDFIKNVHEYYNLKRGELQITDIDFNMMAIDIKALYKVGETVDNTRFEIDIDQDGVFRSDTVSIQIILNNLLSNAFKYQRKNNASKFVSLNIKVHKGIAEFIVKDNGIGIDQVHINYIFDMFYRATSENAGSGFGLYNVKDALRKLNGAIEVNSVPDEGAEFKVTIPSK